MVDGRIKVHPDGYAFVVPDDRSEDIHIAARMRGAGHGQRPGRGGVVGGARAASRGAC